MKRIALMLEQDFKLLLRNAIFWVVTATLVLIIVTVNFLIPADFSATKTELAVYGLGYDVPGAVKLDSVQAVERHVADRAAVGLVYEGGQYTLVHQGIGEKAAAAAVALLLPPAAALPQVDVLELRGQAAVIPENLRLTPVFICFEAMILGFLMASVLMLGEKQEQVLKAYRISPGGATRYVAGKTLLFALAGAAYAALMAVFTVGFRFNWLEFLLLGMIGSALYTLLGMCLAVFFRDMSGWFFTALVILSVNMLPAISYSNPSFSPAWITAIPSYQAIFAYAEVLFPTGKGAALPILLLAVETCVAFVLCTALVRGKLFSAGREA
jgi:hypothetical protein